MKTLVFSLFIGYAAIGCGSANSPLFTEVAEDTQLAHLNLRIILTQDGVSTAAAAKVATNFQSVEMWVYGLSEPSNYAGNLPENAIAHEVFQIENSQVVGAVKIEVGLNRIDLIVKDTDGRIHWFATKEFHAELGENQVDLSVYPLAISDLVFSPDLSTSLKFDDRLTVSWSTLTIPLYTLYKMDYGIGDTVESAKWTLLQTATPQVQLPPIKENDHGRTFFRVWARIPYGDGPKTDLQQGPPILTDAKLVFTLNIPG